MPQMDARPVADADRCLSFGQLILLNVLCCALCFAVARAGGAGFWASVGIGYGIGALVTIVSAAIVVWLMSRWPMPPASGRADPPRRSFTVPGSYPDGATAAGRISALAGAWDHGASTGGGAG